MSHTKRYWIDDHSAIEDSDGKWVLHSDHAAIVQQGIRDHGDWRSKLNFLEADYKAEVARLTAENERLRSKLSFSQSISEICKQTQEGETVTVQGSISSGKTVLPDLCQCERLLAENERLRKAGDAMAQSITSQMQIVWEEWNNDGKAPTPQFIVDWLAAKEGGAK